MLLSNSSSLYVVAESILSICIFVKISDCIVFLSCLGQLESICENTTIADKSNSSTSNFVPALRSGEWSDIGGRSAMEDTHVCIKDLAKNYGYDSLGEEAISFFGVSSRTRSTSTLSLEFYIFANCSCAD